MSSQRHDRESDTTATATTEHRCPPTLRLPFAPRSIAPETRVRVLWPDGTFTESQVSVGQRRAWHGTVVGVGKRHDGEPSYDVILDSGTFMVHNRLKQSPRWPKEPHDGPFVTMPTTKKGRSLSRQHPDRVFSVPLGCISAYMPPVPRDPSIYDMVRCHLESLNLVFRTVEECHAGDVSTRELHVFRIDEYRRLVGSVEDRATDVLSRCMVSGMNFEIACSRFHGSTRASSERSHGDLWKNKFIWFDSETVRFLDWDFARDGRFGSLRHHRRLDYMPVRGDLIAGTVVQTRWGPAYNNWFPTCREFLDFWSYFVRPNYDQRSPSFAPSVMLPVGQRRRLSGGGCEASFVLVTGGAEGETLRDFSGYRAYRLALQNHIPPAILSGIIELSRSDETFEGLLSRHGGVLTGYTPHPVGESMRVCGITPEELFVTQMAWGIAPRQNE